MREDTLLIRIPKAASSSITKAIRPVQAMHVTHEFFEQEKFKYRLISCRNPISRFESAFAFCEKLRQQNPHMKHRRKIPNLKKHDINDGKKGHKLRWHFLADNDYLEINDFVTLWLTEYREIEEPSIFFLPQKHWFEGYKYTHLLRVETLSVDLKNVYMDIYGEELNEVPHINTTQKRSKLNDRSIELLTDYYKEDFELLGY